MKRRVERHFSGILLVSLAVCSTTLADTTSTAEDPWWRTGQEGLQTRLAVEANNHRAKNVILFIGDGMGISTITAARIFAGQRLGLSGEGHSLAFEKFPHSALVKTYNADAQVPDSAGTASAMATGVKARIGTIALRADQPVNACYGPSRDFPATLVERAERRGMATGLVSTARITHATPAAFYSHAPDRDWENDAEMPEEARLRGCRDIAAQLADFSQGNGIDLVLGGGRANFLPADAGGRRMDGRNLVREWQQKFENRIYVDNAKSMRDLKPGSAPVLALFSDSHMAFEADRDNEAEPSLAEMTRFAIERLSRNESGYFLMVEGGRIDHAHHATNAFRALSDSAAFSDAVDTAARITDASETLILVTADHSHVLTMAGYPPLGNPILGLVRRPPSAGEPSTTAYQLDGDGKPYTTLGYQNGPNPRSDDHGVLTSAQVEARDYRQQTGVRMGSETHGGEDVALFARGPKSHLVGGVIEQHVNALGWQFDENGGDKSTDSSGVSLNKKN